MLALQRTIGNHAVQQTITVNARKAPLQCKSGANQQQGSAEGPCLPLSDIFRLLAIPGFDTVNRAVSAAAEEKIRQNYCQKMGCRAMVTDYFDNPIGYSYVSFLLYHNPHLGNGKSKTAFMLDALGGIKRPDILTHKSDRKEYYEIKPASPDGINAGIDKLLDIQAFMQVYKLPYQLGMVYSPTPARLLSTTSKFGPVEVTVSLREANCTGLACLRLLL